MGKPTNRVPSALKHGIYSGIGLLPTEDPAEFQKFKQAVFDELAPAGRMEEGIVEHIACLLWRRQNLFTYCLANRARNRHSSIYPGWTMPMLDFGIPESEPLSPEEQAARRKAADRQARTELGAAMELVKIGEVATIEYLDKELAIFDRLSGVIDRAFKSLLHVRGIKSLPPSGRDMPTKNDKNDKNE
jgi:hypothetical protein